MSVWVKRAFLALVVALIVIQVFCRPPRSRKRLIVGAAP